MKLSNESLGIAEPTVRKRTLLEKDVFSGKLFFSQKLGHFRFPKHLWHSQMVFNGMSVMRMPYPKRDRKILQDCIVPPLQWWYPSKSAYYNILHDMDPEQLIQMIPRKCNPAVWFNSKRKCYSLVVPRCVKDIARMCLMRYFRWDKTKNGWIARRRRNKWLDRERLYKVLETLPEYRHTEMEPVGRPQKNGKGLLRTKRLVFRKADRDAVRVGVPEKEDS